MTGGIIIHECLPKTSSSAWVGPIQFTTLQNAAALPFVEPFEIPQTEWTLVNGNQPNKWVISTATSHNGTNSAYISNDAGVTNSYDTDEGSLVHIYRDISFTGGPGGYTLKFWWKGMGEFDDPDEYDFMKVYLVDISTSPIAGTTLPVGNQLGVTYFQQNSWIEATLELPGSLTGNTKRLVFSWTNDSYLGTQPPAAIDDVSVEVGSFTWTGNISTDWNDPGNWNRGYVPDGTNKVIIPSDPASNPDRFPVITGNYSCYSLVVGNGAIITIQSPYVLNVLNP